MFSVGGQKSNMKEIEIFGANRFETFTKTRSGSRAVVINNGKMLLSHETGSGWWLIPGGGLEENESPEECCVREVEEETGYIVSPVLKFLKIYEFYEEYRYISHYYVCEVTGHGQMALTEAEKKRGLEPQWLPLNEAIDIFSCHQKYADISEEKRGSYLREYTALSEYIKLKIQPEQKII
ncbi:MAG: NUDIX domain-containing protein [Ruminococcus sp.]|nr:NUDIX domain-containing protein [Ruminococcus sp.]